MSVSEAQKRASAKWDKANTKTAACKLSNKEYDLFKRYAESHNKTVSGMLLTYIRECIATMDESAEQQTQGGKLLEQHNTPE